MTSKIRTIRKYQTSFGLTKREAEELYKKTKEQNKKQKKVAAKLYRSTIGQVTVPD